VTTLFVSEEALADAAGGVARRWFDARIAPLLVALRGDLGSGKTTWVRAMLRGLGYSARVPSPTYTLVEHYALGALDIVHLDLYRLADDSELENLGLRDWLAEPRIWLLVEWPERAESLAALFDLTLEFQVADARSRRIVAVAHTGAGRKALGLADFDSNKGS
jgi:tRNA threonylcarbamoyladenosine biosynthesis protein TsaE